MAGRILPAIVGPAEKNAERTSRTEAIATAGQSAAGAGDEDLVRRAAPVRRRCCGRTNAGRGGIRAWASLRW